MNIMTIYFIISGICFPIALALAIRNRKFKQKYIEASAVIYKYNQGKEEETQCKQH